MVVNFCSIAGEALVAIQQPLNEIFLWCNCDLTFYCNNENDYYYSNYYTTSGTRAVEDL